MVRQRSHLCWIGNWRHCILTDTCKCTIQSRWCIHHCSDKDLKHIRWCSSHRTSHCILWDIGSHMCQLYLCKRRSHRVFFDYRGYKEVHTRLQCTRQGKGIDMHWPTKRKFKGNKYTMFLEGGLRNFMKVKLFRSSGKHIVKYLIDTSRRLITRWRQALVYFLIAIVSVVSRRTVTAIGFFGVNACATIYARAGNTGVHLWNRIRLFSYALTICYR